ncbi:glycoside hydrolase family protein [uncultured Desulfobacter sp.]|uniref:glycoside hydrolase family protein n=1 Tax=uncultured Desulfobacter sp. TaxID=240139 RepID=UPI002AAAC095|nr:glycoside hydrolase family protein [uncultured Desulfobacter sp.]
MTRKTNKAGLDLIKKFEGFYAEAYLCPADVWTIGYGHTGDVKMGQVVTEPEAEQLLSKDLEVAGIAVQRYISVPLTDNQFSALVSFTFNLGAGSLKTSTLRKKLNQGNYDAVPPELARWVKTKGKTLPGLVRRRAAEGLFFMQPDDVPMENLPVPDDPSPMPQRIESSDGIVIIRTGYLADTITLEPGSVDDIGDSKYVRLSQNAPDGYVAALQNDLRSLGFEEAGEPDGAFGKKTTEAIRSFQETAGISRTGRVDGETRNALSAWLEQGWSKSSPPGRSGAEAEFLPGGIKLISPQIPHFSQGDPRWAQRSLNRGSSIRREGCAICCIAMVLGFYGRNINPGLLDAYLDANNGYSGNCVRWDIAGKYGVPGSGPELQYDRMMLTPGKEKELEAFLSQRIDRGLPTMVRVDYGTDPGLIYNHFVVCIGKTQDGLFVMNDPATHLGNGYQNTTDDNIIQKTTRKNGYTMVQLDYYDHK